MVLSDILFNVERDMAERDLTENLFKENFEKVLTVKQESAIIYIVLNEEQRSRKVFKKLRKFLKKVLTKSSEYDRMYTAQKVCKACIEPYN